MTELVYFVRGQKHRELLELSIASVRKVYSRTDKVFVYTDDPTLEPLGDLFTVLPAGRQMMVANLDAQLHHVLRTRASTEVLFLDCDVLLRQRFPFTVNAELYPTWRDHESIDEKGEKVVGVAAKMPYNYGVLGAVVTPATKEAFCWLRARILLMADDHRDWFGNQFALYDLCGHPTSSPTRKIRWSLDDPGATTIELCRLPCETWNYSPEKAGEDVTAKGILHFKGGRKDLMEAYL